MATDVTVLGAGNTGFAVAANLTLAGHSVTLGELPAFPEAIAPVRDDAHDRAAGRRAHRRRPEIASNHGRRGSGGGGFGHANGDRAGLRSRTLG